MPKDAYYFPHDSNASQDVKILQMCSIYGAEGYGWYWMLIEHMREQGNYRLALDGKYVINAFALRFYTTEEKLAQFIDDCVNEFKLFQRDDDFLWSESLLRRMKTYDDKREKARDSALVRWEKQDNDTKAMPPHIERNAKAMQVKESKVKESKVKNIHIGIFNHWNDQKVFTHKKLTADLQRAIKAKLQDYSAADLVTAITNYAEIVHGQEYYWRHKWTLKDFLNRGIDKFLDAEVAKENYRIKLEGERNGPHKHSARGYQERVPVRYPTTKEIYG